MQLPKKNSKSSLTVDVLLPIAKTDLNNLCAAVQSVKEQTIRTRLICILNGLSNSEYDEYESLLHELGADVVIRSNTSGVAQALNFGIPYLENEFVARQDADDISAINRLEVLLDYMETNELDVVGSSILIMDQSGDIIDQRIYPCTHKECIMQLSSKTCFSHPSVLFKRQVFTEYCYPLVGSEDYALFLSIYKRFRFGNTSIPLYKWRSYKGQASRKKIPYLYLKRSLSILMLRCYSFNERILMFVGLAYRILVTLIMGRVIAWDFNEGNNT